METKNRQYNKGALIWVCDRVEVWKPATVSEVTLENKVNVFFADGTSRLVENTNDAVQPRCMSCIGDIGFVEDDNEVTDDLTSQKKLSTPDVMYLLRKNYLKDKFYSKLGSGTLLAVNPFKEIPEMFSEKTIRLYSSSTQSKLHELPAHIYASSQSALIKLRASLGRVNQSIIVSGESGAGKTWSVRSLMHYLAEIGIEHRRRISSTGSSIDYLDSYPPKTLSEPFEENTNMNNNRALSALEDLNASIEIVDRIEHRILYSNPILEAFGNARTLRNQNSSRFGKYIQLQYDRTGSIVGAALKTYLLEKTRALRHDSGERSYHIFYQILHGATEDERQKWRVPANPFPEDKSEDNSENGTIETSLNLDESDILLGAAEIAYDSNQFNETKTSMSKIGISTQNQENVFMLLSAVLHLRLLTFIGDDDLSNICELDPDNLGNVKSINTVAQIFGISVDDLLKCIRLREIVSGGSKNKRKSTFHRPCTIQECNTRTGCIAKFIYELLFHWLVGRIAEIICAPDDKWCSFIGLLDVYGFESFNTNSLEQLCINFANEKLQQHFVNNFLREQQEEYTAEGVEWEHCDLTDNIECLQSMESPRRSLFSLINEECRLNRPSDHRQLMTRIELTLERNKFVSLPRISHKEPSFLILHYAGTVVYATEFLIEKNKDEVPVEIISTLRQSRNEFLCQILPEPHNDETHNEKKSFKGKTTPTVLSKFKNSLDDLLTTLSATDCHYIRCIKPNYHSEPEKFESKFVLSQLKACGVVETIRVCAPAHPNKISYTEFFNRYRFLITKRDSVSSDDAAEIDTSRNRTGRKSKRRCMTQTDMRRSTCLRMISALQDQPQYTGAGDAAMPIQFGNTKVFLSSKIFESLENARSEQTVNSAVVIQCAWRNYSHRKTCRRELKKLKEKLNNSATVLQQAWKRFIMKRKCRHEIHTAVLRRNNASVAIQRCWRRYVARLHRDEEWLRRHRACVKIQSVYRGWRVRWKFKDLLDAWTQLRLIEDDDLREYKQKHLQTFIQPLEKKQYRSRSFIKSILSSNNNIKTVTEVSLKKSPLRSSSDVRHAKIITSKSQTVKVTPPRTSSFENNFLTLPRQRIGIPPWHYSPSMYLLRNHAVQKFIDVYSSLKMGCVNSNDPEELSKTFHGISPTSHKKKKRRSRSANHSLSSIFSSKVLNSSFSSEHSDHERSILKNAHVAPLHEFSDDL